MQISKDKVVSFDYTLIDPQGQVLDTSSGRAPLIYMHGSGTIIPGLEKQMEGKTAGHQMKVTIPAAEAYGERNEQMMQSVPRSAFHGVEKIEAGMQFQGQTPSGQRTMVRVVEVGQSEVKIDANHPLAGVELTFDVTVREVREATEEEKSHGHVHSHGGCAGDGSCGGNGSCGHQH